MTDLQQPNLLVIQTDEHNVRTLGCYRKTLAAGQAEVWGAGVVVETPNLDWIAEHGALCTGFYAARRSARRPGHHSSPACTRRTPPSSATASR